MVLNFCSLVVAIVTFLKDFQQQQQQNGKKCIKSKPTPTSIRYTLGCGIVMRSLKSFICMNKQCLFWSFCSFYFQIFAMKYSRYLLCGCIWKFFSDKKKVYYLSVGVAAVIRFWCEVFVLLNSSLIWKSNEPVNLIWTISSETKLDELRVTYAMTFK